MPEKLTFKLLARDQERTDFDWMNIDRGTARVGKVRALIDGSSLTIYSINIFPEFEGRGYVKETIEMFKRTFDTIIADRVRNTASGFWAKMGFVDSSGGNYVYHKKGDGSAAAARSVDRGR
jgi:hypothetical protein